MSEPMVSVVVDSEGRIHWAATASEFVQDGFEDGSLRYPQEVQDAPEDAATGDDHDPTGSDGEPGDWSAADGPAARGDERSGSVEPETDS